MATIGERVRGVAGRAGRALLSFSATAGTAPPADGFPPPSRDHANTNATTVRRLRDRDAMFGRVTYGAGPGQTRYSSYPGTGIEPQQIWNLQMLRNTGYPALWTELLEQVLERDGHLGGVFETRRLSVTDKPFRLHPSRRGDPLATVLAEIAERLVDKIDALDQTFEDLLHAAAYGYAISENVWREARVRIPTPSGSSTTLDLVVIGQIDWVHQKHIRFDRDTDEPYLWLRDGEYTLPPGKFVFHAGAGTGLIEKRGFMGSCVWLSAAKRWSERDWLIYAKLFGIPNILAKYPDGKDEYDEHKDKYVQFLKDWGEGIPALLPDELVTEITREPGGRSSDLHGSIIGWANSELSKRILGSTLTVEIGNQGAYAAADTHRDAPYMRSRSDAKKLAATLRRDVLKPLFWINRFVLADALGEEPDEIMERVPRCSWRIEKEMSPESRQAVYQGAVNELGLEVDEDQYREEMGLDAPRPGGRALRGKPVPIGTGGLAPSVDASQDGAKAPPKQTTPKRPALPAKRPPSDDDED